MIWTFGKDFLSSFVVFLVAIPLCLGVAVASGMPPEAGLITGIIGGLVVGLIGGSPLQVSAPLRAWWFWSLDSIRNTGWKAWASL